MMKKYLTIALALAAVLPVFNSCKAGDDSIRVMSFNVRVGTARDGNNSWEFRKAAVAELINTVGPDIFGVQEALDFQMDYLNDKCPSYSSVGVGRDDGDKKGERMSIFYRSDKYELLDWGTYWLSETPDVPSKGWDAAYPRSATWTRLREKACGREFFYVNTHLDNEGVQARANGLVLLVEKISEMNPDGYPMFLTGDFNTTADDVCFEGLDKLMTSARVSAETTDNSITYNGWLDGTYEPCVIDYIYYSGMKSCRSFRVVNETFLDTPFVSDHYPVLAEIVF